MSPSIGRIVQVKVTTDGVYIAAIVTAVHSDECINVTVFPDCADPHAMSSLTLGDGLHNWRWPPRVD